MNLNLAAERAFPTPLSNSTLLPLLLLSLTRQKHTPDASTTIKKEYDYVIVGGGAAGSVVAARLSEIPCVNVLILEAGPPGPRISEVTGIGISLWTSELSWNMKSTPQKHTGWGLVDRQVSLPTGRALGGTTIFNGGIQVRGNKKDYDVWAASGAKGWSYEEVLPYFKRLEDNQDPEYINNGYHGVGGPVTVMKPDYEPEIKRPVIQAAEDMGYKFVDPNGPTQTGFYDLQANMRENQRCSTAKAYLVPAENRTNLDILPNAFVKKVVIENGRATGVLFDFDGLTYRVSARREVILSAGAINTPHILMLSGIGPKEELQKFNIPVVADLPVGRNFQDHVGTMVNFVLNSRIQEFTEKLSDPVNIKTYIHNRTGPLSSPEGLSIIAFLHNEEITPKVDFPNYQIYFAEGTANGVQEVANMKPEVYQKLYGPYINQSIMHCYVHHLHPQSIGTVTLQSDNPYDLPLIDPNYLEKPQDVFDIVQGMKACMRIGNNHHMKQVVSNLFETTFPGCEKYLENEDRYLECTIRSVLVTYGHYCGTAKMGDPKDPSTVVDPQLRVKDVEGLRVVDASVMPTVPSGNTATPTIMIGEKASDIIKQSIKCYERDPHFDSGYNYKSDEEQESPVYDNHGYNGRHDGVPDGVPRPNNGENYNYGINPQSHYRRISGRPHHQNYENFRRGNHERFDAYNKPSRPSPFYNTPDTNSPQNNYYGSNLPRVHGHY